MSGPNSADEEGWIIVRESIGVFIATAIVCWCYRLLLKRMCYSKFDLGSQSEIRCDQVMS